MSCNCNKQTINKCPYNTQRITPHYNCCPLDPRGGYEIAPSKTNINTYNRYPFKDQAEAIQYLKAKSLQPGEIAIGYYIDSQAETGMNAILAIGNLTNRGNIIKK